MQGLLKINLKGGLKRLISTLIFLMMVSATFPMHMLSGSVWATDPDVTVELKTTSLDNVATWMTEKGDLSNSKLVNYEMPEGILIKVSEDIEISSDVASLPTMTTGSDGNKYLFDFTDKRFKDKTITIDGAATSGGCSTITIDNAGLFFLNMQNCKVILQNIVIDGADDDEIARRDAFINVGQGSKLEVNSATIQNCRNGSESGYGGAINNSGNLKFSKESTVSNCTCEAEKGCGGAVYNQGILKMEERCAINDCACTLSGGAIYNLKQVIIEGGSSIDGHSKGTKQGETEYRNAKFGGAIYNDRSGAVVIDSCSIKNCYAYDFGGAIYNNSTATLTINKCDIADCHVAFSGEDTEHADAIYNQGVLTLPFNKLELLTVTLPEDHSSCTHNSNSAEVCGYDGIYNENGIVRTNPNYRIEFKDATGEELGQGMFTKYSDVCVPQRAGYKLVGLTDEGSAKIDVADDKFKLIDDIIPNANKDGVITLTATYKKVYTIQYIYDNKVVATKKDCVYDQTAINTIMSNQLGNIIVDDNKNLGAIATIKLGYEFSKLTYGDALGYVAGGEGATTWGKLSQVAAGDAIPVFLNHQPKQYSIKYDVSAVKDAAISDQQVKFGEDIKAVTPPKKSGYDFKCWHVLGQDGVELTDPYSKEPIDFETAKANWETLATAADSSNTIKLKAVYMPKKYTIKYNTYSDNIDEETYTPSLDSYVDVSSTKPRRDGYEFKRWVYTKSDGKDEGVTGGLTWAKLIQSAMVDSQDNNVIVLRAEYEKIEPQEANNSSSGNDPWVDGKKYNNKDIIRGLSFFGNA